MDANMNAFGLIDQTAPSPTVKLLFWGGILMVAIAALGIAVIVLRRRTLYRADSAASENFSIGQLESLRDTGQISAEEFKRLRRGLMGLREDQAGAHQAGPAAKTDTNEANCPLSEPPAPDDN